MTLVLRLQNPQELPADLRIQRIEFGENGGVIGRHPDCEWVLDDPQRFVSSRHARVAKEGADFVIEDLSTNGTIVNGDLLGRGNRRRIRHGDRISIGAFHIAVEAEEAQPAVTVAPITPPPVRKPSPSIFDEEKSLDQILKGDEVVDPFAQVPPARPKTQEPSTPGHDVPSTPSVPKDWWRQAPSQKAPTPQPPPAQGQMRQPGAPEATAPPLQQPPIPPAEPPVQQVPAQQSPGPDAEPSAAEAFARAFAEALFAGHKTELTEETGAALGGAMRELLAGTLRLVGARQALRGELRMALTMVGAQENNPYKFAVSETDLLDRFIRSAETGFLPPQVASAQIMQELCTHEYALTAGLEAGVEALLDSLKPGDVPANPLAAGKALKDLKVRHEEAKASVHERGSGSFWQSFARAYEAASARGGGRRHG